MAAAQVPGSEDTVEYCIFPQIPDAIRDDNVVKYVESELDNYVASLGKDLVGYIWQNQSFNLRVVRTSDVRSTHLYGKLCYGDNVEDEWFVIYLLFKLSRDFPGTVVKVWDYDGEVLLIEAAESLPKWLNPETAENRVYIFNGEVHVIPVPQSPAQITVFPSGKPSFQQALSVVRTHYKSTVASKRMQDDIRRRLREFPLKPKDYIHHSNCYVPATLAAVIEKEPGILGSIVQSFYRRDPKDLRSCITFNHFRPGTRVLTRVKFTKCLFAQLMQQQFNPDRRSGFTLPSPKSPDFKAHDLGMKLAHGAEILCSKCHDVSPNAPSSKGVVSRRSPRWLQFVESLTKFGYFVGELEGSLKYNKLLDEAEKYFNQSVKTTSSSDTNNAGNRMLEILNSTTIDIEQLRQKGAKLPPSDNDDWLNLSPEMLDDMLRKVSGKTGPSDAEYDLNQIPESMKNFIGAISSHEGVESPDDDITFDPNSFMQTTQKLFDFDRDDSESDSSSLDEYDSDDDMADSLSPSSPSKGKSKLASGLSTQGQSQLKMKDYMDLMDRELAGTHIGASFEKQSQAPAPVVPPRKKKTQPSPQQKPPPGKVPPQRPPPPKAKPAPTYDDDIDDLDDDFKPVDVDLNLVKNLLESYGAQEGLPGPASNVMGSLGVKLPPKADDQ